ncbi:DUF418 domain-containing protein [Nonomuraea sp. KC401]|uniref:DUF418 domain-containing protein n=1 Tax=unclassified Nonomuraea TaxID=2593643 RepID=UPI0010FD7774|nr:MULTISPECIES: DUF418 domain-containing protein [unclassified Nonomuraea]NBE97172.1 DUF418 domain-containing protein [Nonomuraea sp. K271]TLF83272.1 DUF418 domain-containing protein [Nonomuraea sp. KC401]
MPREEFPGEPTGHPGRHLPDDATASTATPASGRSPTAAPASGRPRIIALDVLRGFTLCEILFANIQLIADHGTAVVTQPMGDWDPWLGLPIFSLLFGIGFALLLDSAADRVSRPRLVLLRRLVALLAIGLVHMVLWPGEILTRYAVVGLLVLLPSSWLPRWAVAGLAAVLVPVALWGGGGPLLIAGLFLLGSALARYGVADQIERSIRGPLLLGLVLAAGTATALWVHGQMEAGADPMQPSFTSSLADLLIAGVVVCALLVLLRTPLRPVLRVVFAPLGRMALTNYLTATLLVLAATHVLGLPIGQSLQVAFLAAGAILAAQWLLSALWLRRYRQGPLEWLWRWATWARRPPSSRVGT